MVRSAGPDAACAPQTRPAPAPDTGRPGRKQVEVPEEPGPRRARWHGEIAGNQWIMSKPLVSVLIDTYNHERFVEQAITSVLDQDMSMANVEILVVDDGSTDRTPDLVRRFEPRVRLLRKPNGGQASAFNLALPQ